MDNFFNGFLGRNLLDLLNSDVSLLVKSRLLEFKDLYNCDNWFSELCFCILTSNSRAQTAIDIQNDIGLMGFLNLSEAELSSVIKSHKHRFHNLKAKYIIFARRFVNIRKIVLDIVNSCNDLVEGQFKAREFLVKNVKGIGYKEASHFLRNVGFDDVAILDRHIIRALDDAGFIEGFSSGLGKKDYLYVESILAKICVYLGLTQSALDLYIWYIKTGNILK